MPICTCHRDWNAVIPPPPCPVHEWPLMADSPLPGEWFYERGDPEGLTFIAPHARGCTCGLALPSHPVQYQVCPIHGKWRGDIAYYDPQHLLDDAGNFHRPTPPGEAMRSEDV